jgi:TfoX N-terminal domain
LRAISKVSKSKLAHFIRITHRDEVEPPITDWLREAYEFSDESLTTDRAKRASELEKGIVMKDREGERLKKSHRPDGAKEKHASPESPLIGRVRVALSGKIDFQEKRMFGRVTFMVREKMSISAGKGRIMCRIDPAVHKSALTRESCRTMIMKGRQYREYVYVDENALKAQSKLDYWVNLSLEYNGKATRALGSGDRGTSAFTRHARD